MTLLAMLDVRMMYMYARAMLGKILAVGSLSGD